MRQEIAAGFAEEAAQLVPLRFGRPMCNKPVRAENDRKREQNPSNGEPGYDRNGMLGRIQNEMKIPLVTRRQVFEKRRLRPRGDCFVQQSYDNCGNRPCRHGAAPDRAPSR